jgi:hypothetical protein
VGIAVKVLHPFGVEGRRSSPDAVDNVAFGQKKLGQIGTILAGDTRDQGYFPRHAYLLRLAAINDSSVRENYSVSRLRKDKLPALGMLKSDADQPHSK